MTKEKMGLTQKIFVGLILGIITGVIFYKVPSNYFKDTVIIGGILKVVGDIFIRSLKMLLVPVVFFSLAVGSSSMEDVGKMGRIGVKLMGFFLFTTLAAVVIALSVGNLINPGIGIDLSSVVKVNPTINASVPISDVIINMVPKNPLEAMVNGDMIPVILFAILLGITLNLIPDKVSNLKKIVFEANDLFLKMIAIIMNMAPYGVFALTTKTFATLGYSAMIPLAKFMIAVILGLILQVCIVYTPLLLVLGRMGPVRIIKKMLPVLSLGFSTASSSAILPITLDVVENDLGVSKRISSFSIPLGTTVNMDGTAILQGVAAIFVAQAYGIPLNIQSYLTIIFTATLASIGTAGVAGSGLIMLSMVLTSVGLPLEGIALIIGIDRILDMCRTVVNIIGNSICSVIIAKQENDWDKDVFLSDKKSNKNEAIV